MKIVVEGLNEITYEMLIKQSIENSYIQYLALILQGKIGIYNNLAQQIGCSFH